MLNVRGVTMARADGTEVTFKSGEAYALMKYQSDATGRVEWLWNSRDGVTPFLIGDPVEGLPLRPPKLGPEGGFHDVMAGMMNHVDWHEDMFAPNFVPPVGMRIFVDHPKGPTVAVVDEALHLHFGALAAENPFVPGKEQ